MDLRTLVLTSLALSMSAPAFAQPYAGSTVTDPTPAASLVPARERGMIGVRLGEEGGQPLIHSTLEGGPAERAGLQAGDRIIAVGDRKVSSHEVLGQALAGLQAGDEVYLTVERDGWRKSLALTLAPASQFAEAGAETVVEEAPEEVRLFKVEGGLPVALVDVTEEADCDGSKAPCELECVEECIEECGPEECREVIAYEIADLESCGSSCEGGDFPACGSIQVECEVECDATSPCCEEAEPGCTGFQERGQRFGQLLTQFDDGEREMHIVFDTLVDGDEDVDVAELLESLDLEELVREHGGGGELSLGLAFSGDGGLHSWSWSTEEACETGDSCEDDCQSGCERECERACDAECEEDRYADCEVDCEVECEAGPGCEIDSVFAESCEAPCSEEGPHERGEWRRGEWRLHEGHDMRGGAHGFHGFGGGAPHEHPEASFGWEGARRGFAIQSRRGGPAADSDPRADVRALREELRALRQEIRELREVIRHAHGAR